MDPEWVSPSRRKKGKLSHDLGAGSSLGGGSFTMPLTERQQMAYLMAMTAKGDDPIEDSVETKKVKRTRLSPTSMINKPINKSGETQLHISAMKGDIEVTKNLIKQGADVNCKDHAGISKSF